MAGCESQSCTSLSDADLIRQVDDQLQTLLEAVDLPGNLRDAIHYALFSGGKRVRPLMVLRCCQAVGGDLKNALPAAGAIELIHCFSLVHDDLPAMDDDDLRRGRPTLHKHTNEAMAILAGDAMTTLAFQLLTQWHKDGELAAALVHVLSSATRSMIAGQVYDTMGGFQDGLSDHQKLLQIHREKTGALLTASAHMGSLSGGGSPAQTAALVEYADHLGLMFQAVDDLLDVTQSSDKMGKATGKDAAAGKLTYPGLMGVDGTRQEIARLLEVSLAAIAGFGPPADPLRGLAHKLAARQH